MTTVTTRTVSVLKRDWLAIEPKLLAVLAGLASASVLIEVAKLFHYNLDPGLAVAIAGFLSLIVGYFKSSTLTGFPVGEAVKSAGDIVAAAAPSIRDQVATVESVIAPAFEPTVQATVTEAPAAPGA